MGVIALVVRLNPQQDIASLTGRSFDVEVAGIVIVTARSTDTRQPPARTASARAGLPCAKLGVGSVSDFGADETMYMYFEMFARCLGSVLIKDEHREAIADQLLTMNGMSKRGWERSHTAYCLYCPAQVAQCSIPLRQLAKQHRSY